MYLCGDSTAAFEMDNRDKLRNPRADYEMLWKEEGIELRAVSGTRLPAISEHMRDLPRGSSVLLVGGWNSKPTWRWNNNKWEWETPSQAIDRITAEFVEMRETITDKSLIVVRACLREPGCMGTHMLEDVAQEILPDVPVIKNFALLYRTLDQGVWNCGFEDPHHRRWTKTAVHDIANLTRFLTPTPS